MTPNTPETSVNAKHGAPMGRPTRGLEYEVLDNARPFTLRRVRLDSGGYDQGGAYWGHGAPLYYWEGPLSDLSGYVRGRTRDHAKAEVRAIHPRAKFFR